MSGYKVFCAIPSKNGYITLTLGGNLKKFFIAGCLFKTSYFKYIKLVICYVEPKYKLSISKLKSSKLTSLPFTVYDKRDKLSRYYMQNLPMVFVFH